MSSFLISFALLKTFLSFGLPILVLDLLCLLICLILLQSIRKSECPRELEPADRRSSVHVNLIRRMEEYRVSILIRFHF